MAQAGEAFAARRGAGRGRDILWPPCPPPRRPDRLPLRVGSTQGNPGLELLRQLRDQALLISSQRDRGRLRAPGRLECNARAWLTRISSSRASSQIPEESSRQSSSPFLTAAAVLDHAQDHCPVRVGDVFNLASDRRLLGRLEIAAGEQRGVEGLPASHRRLSDSIPSGAPTPAPLAPRANPHRQGRHE